MQHFIYNAKIIVTQSFRYILRAAHFFYPVHTYSNAIRLIKPYSCWVGFVLIPHKPVPCTCLSTAEATMHYIASLQIRSIVSANQQKKKKTNAKTVVCIECTMHIGV